MSGFFDYENRIMSTISKIADTVVLSVLWVLCSIPVFTIGASSAALYYTYNHCIVQRLDHAWSTFFSSFKSNFKQATVIWLVALGLILLALLDCYLLTFLKDIGFWVLIIQAAVIIFLLAGIIWGLYLFPYLSRFSTSNKGVMKNCALIALANMPRSLLLLVIFAVCAVGFLSLPMLNLFIPAVYTVITNRILEKIFLKYMTPEEQAAQLELRRKHPNE